jgi:hypothetical protein
MSQVYGIDRLLHTEQAHNHTRVLVSTKKSG